MVAPPTPTRHERFYFTGVSDGPNPELVTFQVSSGPSEAASAIELKRWTPKVNNKLYRVYRQLLEKSSAAFASMFAVPQGSEEEGMSDEKPITLEGVPVEEFEALLFVLYPVYVRLPTYTRNRLSFQTW
jgi:hypothetical protein